MVRSFDLFWSVLGLLLLSPVFLVVGLFIKAEDGGPVFFLQLRVGFKGRAFWILKFRTMRLDAEQAGLSITVGQDPRITRVGRWLRKAKIDELPQLVNVVLGQMGLVGPRPEVPRFVALYTEEQAKVLLLRPGITDAASIMYRCENEVLRRSADPEAFYIENIMPNKLRVNLAYAAQATLWTHFKVILATLGLLKPPVKVRSGEDLRAFDRVAVDTSSWQLTDPRLTSAVHSINLSLGGILLEAFPIGVGEACTLASTHGQQEGISAQGVVIRSDGGGTAIRFLRPLADATYSDWERAV
jgi:lipopolysaccharide/colanic/teichoic acid biosynthesis glycosyltransferase